MFDDLRRLARNKLGTRSAEGPGKVLPLSEALRRFVRPGMLVHIAQTPGRPMAAVYELLRQYRGRQPGFTIVTSGFNPHMGGAALVRSGIVRKVIAGYVGCSYPNPSPSRTHQSALREGAVEFEHWSLLTLALRLKAAAMGVPFLTTRSLVGSTMAADNAHAFRVVDDPFHPGQLTGAVAALYPDVAIVHGLAADAEGNTLLPPHWHENDWGAMAARGGAVVTVERIVSTDVIRRHNHFGRLPGYCVQSVSEVPFGAHPSSVNSQWIQGLDGYAEDYDFLLEIRKAERDPKDLDAWAERWIYSVADHQEYLDKVGFQRLLFLRGKALPDSYEQELESVKAKINPDGDYNAPEHMVAVSSRIIAEAVREKRYRTVLAGIGASNLAAWLAHAMLKDQGVAIDLMAETGFYGYTPRPADPFIFNHRNIFTCKGLWDIEHVLGVFTSGGNNSCLGSLGAGQIDRRGNVNSTFVPPDTLLVGSGGGNDIASGCSEIVVTVAQSRARFLDELPYITSPGRAVSSLVSTLGVYQKLGDDPEFTLTGYLARPGLATPEEAVRAIKEQCGWELKIATNLRRHEPPSLEELRLMRLFDPHRQFIEE